MRSVPEQFRKCYGSVTKVLRSSYESVPEQLVSFPEQLVSVPEQLLSLPEQLYLFRSSFKSSVAVISLPEQL